MNIYDTEETCLIFGLSLLLCPPQKFIELIKQIGRSIVYHTSLWRAIHYDVPICLIIREFKELNIYIPLFKEWINNIIYYIFSYYDLVDRN